MIFFNVAEARGQLLDSGVVYTLRREGTRTGVTYAVMGTYADDKLLCRVEVTRITRIEDMRDLHPYLGKSGFNDVSVWLSKASPSARTLYKVVRVV